MRLRLPKISLPSIPLPPTIKRLPRLQKIELAIFLILLLGLVPTLIAAKTIQELRSRADEKKAVISCKKVDVDFTGLTPNPRTAGNIILLAKQVDRELDQEIKDYIQWEKKHSYDATATPVTNIATLDDFPVAHVYAAKQCTKDKDCGGDKVCKKGACEKKRR